MMFKLSLASIFWLATLASAARSPDPVPDSIGRRAVTLTTVVTSTTSTVTANPSDPTVWTVTSVITVTEMRTDVPLTTRHSLTVETVTMTTDLTEHATQCTNTAVLSFYVGTIYTSTQISAGTTTRATQTQVCMTSTTRWLPLPNVTFVPPYTTPYWDPDYYTNGSIITVAEPLTRTSVVTTSTDVVTSISIICDNPTTVVTSTYFTVTSTEQTTTVQPTGCGSSSESPTAPADTPTPTDTPAASPALRRKHDVLRDVQAGGEIRRQVEEPVGTKTVTFITTGVLSDGATVTVTRTGIVETYTRTVTTIVMVGKTITATATQSLSECSSPAAVTSG
ncbi:uncharacterized protein B0H64DRAFT_436034 [Chaetomium fimeti]|uniref:Uncharacterized protein n=1 Tax=Chaetomium fimeti TaxID=1854472 RepID=A0AAE0H724_9PEZI|nr:hypothetical protein B0H64DRAFT_436034 [Chaetomium fimeti]